MPEPTVQPDERSKLLSDVAEMYYEDGLTQSEIADTVVVTETFPEFERLFIQPGRFVP